MKKLMIYFFVGGFVDSYEKISYKEALNNDQIFTHNGYYYFRRHRSDNSLELVSSGFVSKDDPLLRIILENRRTYMIWEEVEWK